MARKTTPPSQFADWLPIGGRVLLVAALTFAYLIDGKALGSLINVILPVLVGLGILALCRAAPSLNNYIHHAAMLTDILIAGTFVAASGGEPLLVVAIVGGVLLVGLVNDSFAWSAAQIVGVLAASVVGLALSGVTTNAPEGLGTALLMAVALGLIALASASMLDRQIGRWRQHSRELAAYKKQQSIIMRDRTRAIYELAYAMSSTLKYEKVLDAALEAGYLGLNMTNGSGLIAGVFLFHADDNMLHLISSRGFARADNAKTIRGVEGIVGQALREVTPMFGTTVRSDPELNIYVGLQQSRSLLVIPLCARFDNFGVLIYASDKPNAFDIDHSDMLTAIGVHATIALQNALLYRELVDEKERLVDVEEEARKKLARDLHDGATQSVAAIAMRMSYIYKLLEKKPDDVLPELRKVEELARKTTKEIRHLLFTLRPLVLETQGLVAALNQLAEKMQETHSQAVVVRADRDVEMYLERHQQGMIFYIVEEAVNNARKHAQASLITVTISRQIDSVLIEIRDNGIGFNMEKVGANYDMRGSLGMINMRERADVLHGTLSIQSSEGSGTTITVLVPFYAPDMTPAGGIPTLKRGTTKLALAAHMRDSSRPGVRS
jgi:signal transduction histidine kinase